ncbi:ZIP zinc transporter-domain-containing protein [Hyaloraphidium curvatum]|nr:ZIP zinc transporter-domain-containing protein [Hyaloraphidium curvatum]
MPPPGCEAPTSPFSPWPRLGYAFLLVGPLLSPGWTRLTFSVPPASNMPQLLASGLGAALPLLSPPPAAPYLRAFGAGAVLATAFVHVLAPSFAFLSSECLGWGTYPWGAAAACGAALLGWAAQAVPGDDGTGGKRGGSPVPGVGGEEDEAELLEIPTDGLDVERTGESVGAGSSASGRAFRARGPGRQSGSHLHHPHGGHGHSATLSLELGIASHSLVIGIALGAAEAGQAAALAIALSVHQFFEGVALCGAVLDAGMPEWRRNAALAVYTASTPTGVLLGAFLRASSSYDPNGGMAGWINLLEAAAGGILAKDAFAELLPEAEAAFRGRPMAGRAAGAATVFAGAAVMCLIGIWA